MRRFFYILALTMQPMNTTTHSKLIARLEKFQVQSIILLKVMP